VRERPDAVSISFAFAAFTELGATFHSFAAASMSRSRAAEATRRSCGVMVASSGCRSAGVEGREGGIAHDHAHAFEWHAQLVSDGLRERGANVLADSTLPQNAVTEPSSPMCSQALMSEGKSC